MMSKKLFEFVVVGFIVILGLIPVIAAAQDSEVPEFMKTLLSPTMLAYIAAVCGFTKYARNIFNVKGKIALAMTFVVSLIYSYVQYKDLGLPAVIGIGLLAAAVGAGLFKGTKLLGKEVINPTGTK